MKILLLNASVLMENEDFSMVNPEILPLKTVDVCGRDVNAAVNTTVKLGSSNAKRANGKPRKLQAITVEAAQLKYRAKTRDRRLRRDSQIMRRLEHSVQVMNCAFKMMNCV